MSSFFVFSETLKYFISSLVSISKKTALTLRVTVRLNMSRLRRLYREVKMNKIIKFRFWGIAAVLAVIAVFSVVVMLLWNALMPDIFGLPVISYWLSLGLSVLACILFGCLDFMGGRRFALHGGQGRDGRNFHHRNALREKWMNMSEEERSEFMHRHHEFGRFHDFFDEERRGEPLCVFKDEQPVKRREPFSFRATLIN
ncbi:MAG: hypothetical protein Pg6C_14300 [Treponemataceae bacterium]|nr:MAG: hypothetical protein Pg6C_14300 [Treponemataceae bacterium]